MKGWHLALAVFVVAYLVGVYFPDPGRKALSLVGLS